MKLSIMREGSAVDDCNPQTLAKEQKAPHSLLVEGEAAISDGGFWRCDYDAAKLTGSPPLMPKGQLSFLQVDSYPSAQRATTELGLTFTPLSDGLSQTVSWLRSTGKLPAAAAAS